MITTLSSTVCRALLRSVLAIGLVVVVVGCAVHARDARRATARWPAVRHEQLPRALQCLATASTARLVTTLHVRACRRHDDNVLTIDWNADVGTHTFSRGNDDDVDVASATTPAQARTMALTVASAVGLPTTVQSSWRTSLQRWAEVVVTCDGETTRLSLPMSTDSDDDNAFDVIAWAAHSDVTLDHARVVSGASAISRALGGDLVVVDDDHPLAAVLPTRPLRSAPTDALDTIFFRLRDPEL